MYQTNTPARRHPLTGDLLAPIYVSPRTGRAFWPIMGGDSSNDPPERPEDITEDVWDALGDPGKAALVREREARQEAERQLAAAKAPKPAPPKSQPSPAATSAPKDGEPDVSKIVQDAVTAAIKPFQEAESQRQAEAAAGKVRDAVIDAAKPLLHDATDALANVDLTTLVNDEGQADPEKVKAALVALVEKKPHLAKPQQRFAPPGIGGGAPAATTDAEKVKAVLADMQRATGVRQSTSTT